jgi:hypothetical protein
MRVGAVALTAPTLLSVEGCSMSTQEIENLINIALVSAAAVVAVADSGASWLPEFQAAIKGLQTAEASWVGGGPVADVIQALNTLVVVTNDIPLGGNIGPLIDVLVAGLDAVLSALPIPTVSEMRKSIDEPEIIDASYKMISLSMKKVSEAKMKFNHHGRKHLRHYFLHSYVADYKAQWNGIVKADPTLAKAAI